MVKIYLAGRFANKDKFRELGNKLELKGHEITCKWWDIEQTYAPNRSLDESKDVGRNELNGVINADIIIVIVDDANYPYRGTLTEVGIAMGYLVANNKEINKHIYIICNENLTNKNCGFLCVPHITLANIMSILKDDNFDIVLDII